MTTKEVTVMGTVFARNLQEGDQFILRRASRGRPAVDEQPPSLYVAKRDAEVTKSGTVRVFVLGQFRALTFNDPNYRVRLVG